MMVKFGTLLLATCFCVPGYWETSALARYKIAPRIGLQLNVDNITNRRFYDGLDDNHVNISAARVARLSLIVQR